MCLGPRGGLSEAFIRPRTVQLPVLVAQNVSDDVTPAADTYEMANAWRAAGADVTVAKLDTPPLLPQAGVAGHSAGLLLDNPTAVG